jgi:hypothetical protein
MDTLYVLPSQEVDPLVSVLQTRTEKSLSKQTLDIIKMISLGRKQSDRAIVGSFKYAVHEYPGDIDLMESVQETGPIKDAKRRLATGFRRIAGRIAKQGEVFLGDFKAGIDARYYIDIGEYVLPHLHSDKLELVGYSKKRVLARIAEIHKQGLLTHEEAARLRMLVVATPDYVQHKALMQEVRRLYVIRWSLEELIAGVKRLPFDKRMRLEDAIAQKTVVKLDVWCWINERFVEITNWFNLTCVDCESHHHLSLPFGNLVENLVKDIEIYTTPQLKGHMKLAKRIWRYAIVTGKGGIARRIAPLFSSSAAKLYQIQNDIEVLLNMMEKLTAPPMAKMLVELQEIKMRMGTVLNSVLPVAKAKEVFRLIDGISGDRNGFVKSLAACFEIIQGAVDVYTKRYLKQHLPV